MSSEKTANLGMHKWMTSDYVKMAEFNENFKKLDDQAGEIKEAKTDIDGVVQAGLPERLTADFGKVTAQLAETSQQIATNAENLVGDLQTEFVRIGNLQTFKDALAKKYVRIAFWGDSITVGGDYLLLSDTYVEQFMKKLREAFPDVTFDYVNYGIGGLNLEQAASADFTSPTDFDESWATVEGQSWRDYVKNYRPDVLFIAFGMNPNWSGAKTTSAQLETIRMYFDALTNAPSYILMTNFLPRSEWAGVNYSERLLSARETTYYAEKNGLTLLNVYNRYRSIVDGVDESKRIVERYTNYDNFATADPLADSIFKVLNFKYKENVTLWDTNQWAVYFRGLSYIRLTKTTLKVYGFADTTISLADGGHSLEIEVINNTIKVWVDGTLLFETSSYFGDELENYMSIGWSTGEGAISQRTIHKYGFGTTNSKFTIQDIVGEYVPGDYSLKLPNGGNGVNHPTSVGFNYLYIPLIEEFIRKFKNDVNLPRISTIPKTFTFDLSTVAGYAYRNITDSVKVPFLVGELVDSVGTVYIMKKNTVFKSDPSIDELAANEYFLRRTAGKVQLLMKTPATMTGWKFTTNVLLD